MICAQCHSLRDIVAPDTRAGADYYDYFQPVLEHEPQKAKDPATGPTDGPAVSRTSVGLWQSQCFLQGGATCTNCHRAHVPDVDPEPAAGASEQRALHACHQPIGEAVTAHTRIARQRRQFVRRVPHAEGR